MTPFFEAQANKNYGKMSPAELKTLANRLRTEYELWKDKYPEQQNEEVINQFILIKSELRKRGQALLKKNTHLDLDAAAWIEIVKIKPIPFVPEKKTFGDGEELGGEKVEDSDKFEGEEENDYAPVNTSGTKDGDAIKLNQVEPYFKSFVVANPMTWLVGGVITHKDSGTKGDIDVLITAPSKEELERVISFRISRMVPEELRKRLHLLCEERGGLSPFTDYLNLYKLVMERIPDGEIVKMGEILDVEAEIRLRTKNVEKQIKEAEKALKLNKITPGEFHLMPKPVRGYYPSKAQTLNLFLDIYDKYYEFPSLSSKKFDGERIGIHKSGDKIKIFSEDGEVLEKLPNLKNEVKTLKPEITVLEAELENWAYPDQHLPRESVSTGIAEDNFVANVFDILYFKGEIPDELYEEIKTYDEDKEEWKKKYLKGRQDEVLS